MNTTSKSLTTLEKSFKEIPKKLEEVAKNNLGITLEMVLFIFIIIILVILIVSWIVLKLTLNSRNCASLNIKYKEKPSFGTINYNYGTYKNKALRDFYVKSAYNCCSAGTYKNDFVSLCALDNCIKQGARFLDFEIYSIDNKPVIAVSSKNNYNLKQTYNSLPLGEALEKINRTAFSSGRCSNYNDPLILHFRIMSNITEMYENIANSLISALGNRLLGKEYSYSKHNGNFGDTKIDKLAGKVIIVVDNKNTTFQNTDTSLTELVNINSNNSKVMRTMRFFDIKHTHEATTLTYNNKEFMTACIPDLSHIPVNPSPSIPMQYGCQFIAMAFQNLDEKMLAYHKFFDDNNSAFVLKPRELRYIPRTINIKEDPVKALTFGNKNLVRNYFGTTLTAPV
tara:strand:- start:3189 stop:4376 length:1188 start_codon:yes stop_codon:yes gene_type:complete